MDLAHSFGSVLWEAGGENTWVFVSLPSDVSDEIADLAPKRPGFGSVRVKVRIGETDWTTSLFPDSKLGLYVLPVKRSVREREKLSIGDTIDVEVHIVSD
jgi:hypothetical protein